MDDPLDIIAVRVVGALMEKEATTPANYPLTLNALVAACNQTSNRDPVLALDDASVSEAIKELSRRSFVREVHRSDTRVKRYRQSMSEAMSLHPAETAVMCVLMLRGAQTTGEIRTRTLRLFEFRDLTHVEVTLHALMTLTTPLVARLPRQPGQKEARYAHLLSGEPQAETTGPALMEPAKVDRIDALEQALDTLRTEMAELRTRFEAFRREFQ